MTKSQQEIGQQRKTLKANAEMAKNLPFADRQDFDDAMEGFVGTVPDALVPMPL